MRCCRVDRLYRPESNPYARGIVEGNRLPQGGLDTTRGRADTTKEETDTTGRRPGQSEDALGASWGGRCCRYEGTEAWPITNVAVPRLEMLPLSSMDKLLAPLSDTGVPLRLVSEMALLKSGVLL